MPDQVVQIQTPVGILNIDSTQATVGANTVQRQRVNLTDSINNVQQTVQNTALSVASDPGVGGAVTRPVPPTLTKGTQGSLGYMTQALSDAGRNNISIFMDQVSLTGNVLAVGTFTIMKNGVQTTGQTTYAITSGKTLRLHSLSVDLFQSGAAATTCKVYLMINTAGAVTAAAAQQAMAFFFSSPATALSYVSKAYDFGPQGFEIPAGSSTNIGIGFTPSVTAQYAMSLTLTGFEY